MRSCRRSRSHRFASTREKHLRPNWRVIGAVTLWLVLEWYGATSEVSWLFLLAAWVLAFIAACSGYAVWNRAGLRLHLAAAATRPGELSPSHDLPEHVLRTGPLPAPIFEGDDLSIEVGLNTTGSSRGPAWVAGSVAGSDVIFGTGLVPTTGWRRTKVLRGVRRGSVGATRWAFSVARGLARTSRSRSCSRASGRLQAVARRASSRPAWWHGEQARAPSSSASASTARGIRCAASTGARAPATASSSSASTSP